jgi:hypothetical protein
MSALEQYIAPFILCCLIVAAAVQAIKQVTWLKLGKERPAPLRHNRLRRRCPKHQHRRIRARPN